MRMLDFKNKPTNKQKTKQNRVISLYIPGWPGTQFVKPPRQGFSVALEPVLELALVDQADLELTEIRLPLPPECWD